MIAKQNFLQDKRGNLLRELRTQPHMQPGSLTSAKSLRSKTRDAASLKTISRATQGKRKENPNMIVYEKGSYTTSACERM
jgi:hypothetical protein